jgi:hypothetical protein
MLKTAGLYSEDEISAPRIFAGFAACCDGVFYEHHLRRNKLLGSSSASELQGQAAAATVRGFNTDASAPSGS